MIAHGVRHYCTINFILQYSTNSRENSVGVHAGADTARVRSHEHVMCVRTILEGWVAGMGVSSIGMGAAAPWCVEWCAPRCVDVWRRMTMTCRYECRDAWIAWGGWQMREEGCQDAGNTWRWGIQMCLVQGVTTRGYEANRTSWYTLNLNHVVADKSREPIPQ